MSLGCNIEEVKHNAFNIVKKRIEGKSTTIKMNNNGIVTFNPNKSSKYSTVNAAYTIAQSKVKAVEKLMEKEVGPKFNKGWLTLNQNANEVWLEYKFPVYVENAYKNKFAVLKRRAAMQQEIEEARNVQSEDARRLGIEEINDNYLYFNYQDDFDDLGDPDLDNPEPEFIEPEVAKEVVDLHPTYINYIAYKKSLLARLEEKLKNFRIANKNKQKNDKYKEISKRYSDSINTLKEQIVRLDKDKIENIFDDIIQEIDYLDNILNTLNIDVFSNNEIGDRIDFLYEMTSGISKDNKTSDFDMLDGSEFEDYNDKIVIPAQQLKRKLIKSNNDLLASLIENDVMIKKVLSEGAITRDDINKLLESQQDIKLLHREFTGINSGNDSLITSLIKTAYETNIQKSNEQTRELNENLKKLDKKLKDKKFDENVFFEKDDDGIDTGNIIHKFSRKYFTKKFELYNYVTDYINSSFKDKSAKYAKIIAFHKQNDNLFDFTKLSHFKNLYETAYSEYFTASDQEMTDYENELRSKLGKMYDSVLKNVENKLNEYELERVNIDSTSKNPQQRISMISPWLFTKNYESNDAYNPINYQDGPSTYQVFNYNSEYIEFFPKDTVYDVDTMENVDTGFYNKEFETIENDTDAFQTWETLVELYNDHINPTFKAIGQDVKTLSWAKFNKTLAENLSSDNPLMKRLSLTKDAAIDSWKQAWFNKGNYNSKSNIKSNYIDTSTREIRNLTKLYNLKKLEDLEKLANENEISTRRPKTDGLAESDKLKSINNYRKELANKLARKQTLNEYSKDLIKTTLALSDLSNTTRARVNSENIVTLLTNMAKNIKDDKNKDRHNSNQKIEKWVRQNVLNITSITKNNPDDITSKEKRNKNWQIYLNEGEKQMKSLIAELRKNGVDNDADHSFFNDDTKYISKDGKKFKVVKDKLKPIHITEYETALQEWFTKQIKDLGIGITVGSAMEGYLGIQVKAALSINFRSALFNRQEGLFTNWTMLKQMYNEKDLDNARSFMMGANLMKISNNKLPLRTLSHKMQMQTFSNLVETMGLFQDRKNELQRQDGQSKYSKLAEFNLMKIAVDYPEFKNQSEIILTHLASVPIIDNTGKVHKFFDGSGFPGYKQGTLELRDEFKYNTDGTINQDNIGWENFTLNDESTNDFFVHSQRITDTISKTQGNYADNDSISIMNTTLSKLMMTFVRWMPEHVNQRFGRKDNDVISGRKEFIGRYREMLSRPSTLAITAGITAGIITTGAIAPTLGIAAIAGTTGLIGIPIMSYINKMRGREMASDKDIVKRIFDIQTGLGYMQEIVLNSLNNVPRLFYKGLQLSDRIPNKRLNPAFNNNITLAEANALKAMAQELANQIMMMGLLLTLKALTWDDDDKDTDTRRRLHNFIDNNLNRSITTLTNWSNPQAFLNDNSRLAMLRPLGDIINIFNNMRKYMDKEQGSGKEIAVSALKLLPTGLPKTLLNTQGNLIGLDDKEYQKGQWFDDLIKGEEWKNEQVLKNRRKLFKEHYIEHLEKKYEGKEIDGDDLDAMIEKQTAKRMRKADIKKSKSETATEALERIDFDAKIEELE